MIAIDDVYQKVLALANREQRGYITPQEFNLLADKAQMEIFDSYFHDFKTVDLKPKSNIAHSDDIELLQEKLQPFKTVQTISIDSGVSSFSLPTLAYRINSITVGGIHVPEMATEEIIYSENNPLTKATLARMVFERKDSSNCKIYPTPTSNIELSVSCYKTPSTPKWNYIVVQGSALFNSTGVVNFQLHASEEEVLVSKILAFAGVTIMNGELVQYGGGMESSIKQSQND
jgi:hypothetical protein